MFPLQFIRQATDCDGLYTHVCVSVRVYASACERCFLQGRGKHSLRGEDMGPLCQIPLGAVTLSGGPQIISSLSKNSHLIADANVQTFDAVVTTSGLTISCTFLLSKRLIVFR